MMISFAEHHFSFTPCFAFKAASAAVGHGGNINTSREGWDKLTGVGITGVRLGPHKKNNNAAGFMRRWEGRKAVFWGYRSSGYETWYLAVYG